MLTIGRKRGEQTIIDAGNRRIEITVVSTRGGKVKLGFNAPADVRILRKELEAREERIAA